MQGSNPVLRATVAGGVAGAVATVSIAVLSVALVARIVSKHMPAMMDRMMSEGCCSEMTACLERSGTRKDATE